MRKAVGALRQQSIKPTFPGRLYFLSAFFAKFAKTDHHMKTYTIFAASVIALALTSCHSAHENSGTFNTHLSAIAPGYSATSVNTAVFRTNSVVSHGDTQYAAYYDPEGYVTLASRQHDSDNWTIERSQYKGKVADAHNVISIGIDGDGYIHAAFDHHGDSLHYARSIRPASLTLGPLMPMTGENEADVTYPEFHLLPDGTLMFAYRSGFSGGGNMVLNRYSPETKTWSRVHTILLDGEGDRNAYWQMTADDHGTIHLSWVWRESWLVETNHDLCYARSRDGGVSWERSDGTPYTLPIKASEAEIAWAVPQNSELINQTSMTADSKGRPLIATYWRDQNDSVPRYRLVSHDGERWNMSVVGSRNTPFSLSGGGTKMIPIARPQVLADGDEIYFVFRDAERGSRVSLAYRPDAETDWTVTDLTDFSVDAWEPSIDPTRWAKHKELDIYVQATSQGDGERTTDASPQTVNILEVRKN